MNSSAQQKLPVKLLALIATAVLVLALILGYGLSQKASADESQGEGNVAATFEEPAAEAATQGGAQELATPAAEEAVATEPAAEEAVAEDASQEVVEPVIEEPAEVTNIKTFTDLKTALAATDAALGSDITVPAGAQTLDLTGHELYCGQYTIIVANGAQLTVTNSAREGEYIDAINALPGYKVFDVSGSGSKLTITNDVAVKLGDEPAEVSASDTVEAYSDGLIDVHDSAELNITGGDYSCSGKSIIKVDDAKLNISGGFFNATGVNATCVVTYGSSVVNITGGEFHSYDIYTLLIYDSTVEISNAIFTASYSNAICIDYLPSQNRAPQTSLTINSGTFTSESGSYYTLFASAGDIAIKGGTFISENDDTIVIDCCEDNNGALYKSSLTVDGGYFYSKNDSALVSYGGGDAIINGGTFESDANAAVYFAECYNPNTFQLYKANLVINGGNFISHGEYSTLYDYGADVTVNDGIFMSYASAAAYVGTYTGGEEGFPIESLEPMDAALTINGGKFYGSNYDTISASTLSNLYINGGEFYVMETDDNDDYSLGIADNAKTVILKGGFFYNGIAIWPYEEPYVDALSVEDVIAPTYTNLDQLLADSHVYLEAKEGGVVGERYTAVDTATATDTPDSICVAYYAPAVPKTGDSLIAVYAALGVLLAAAGALVLARVFFQQR